MKIGDPYTWLPAAFEGDKSSPKPSRKEKLRRASVVTGRIVYIHPQGRYFTAESPSGASVIRESFVIVQDRLEV